MSLTFTITPPYTDSPSSFTVIPSHYKIVQPFMGHQQLEFEQFKTNPRIQRRSKVVVTGDDPDKPNFLGWVVQYEQPNPAKNLPQKYICYSFSKDLEWRYPWLKTYTSSDDLQTILNHTPASEGMLYRANSLLHDNWELIDAGLSLYKMDFAGLVDAARFADPTIYLGTTLTTGQDPYTDPYTLGVNEWCQDDYTLYLRTGGNDPYDYPCYIVDFKQAYLKRSTSAPSVNLLENIYPSQESEYSLFKRIMRSVGKEYEFVNNSDGYQHLNWGETCARGNIYDPWAEDAFAFEEAGCGYGFPELYDWGWSILDPDTYGFDLISLRGENIVANYVGLNSYTNIAYMYWRHWKEDVRRDSSMGDTQVYTEGAFLRDHYMKEEVLNIWAPENHSILPGDWVWIYLCTSPFSNEYLGRVLEKTLEDDVMKLDLGLFMGDPWW